MTRISCLVMNLLAGSAGMSYGNDPAPPKPEIPAENFTDSGYIQISWSAEDSDQSLIFQLEQADNPGFTDAKVIYEGPDRASFISGLPDGNYYFRVRTIIDGRSSEWSRSMSVVVKHHSLAMAFSLASIGIIVFLLTVGVVVKGIKNDKES